MNQIPISEIIRQEKEYKKQNKSLVMLPSEVLHDKRIKGETLRVYCLFLSYSDKREQQLSVRYVAEYLGISTKTAHLCINKLLSYGYITIVTKGTAKNNTGTVYTCAISV